MVTRAENGDAFEAALQRRLGGETIERTTDCLAPEALAAYYDRTFTRPERERAEAHLADCARCQAALAALARGDIAPARAPRQWAPAWAPGWRVAIPALAALLVLAVAVGRMRRNAEIASPQQLAMARNAMKRFQKAAPAAAETPASAVSASSPAAPAGELALNEAHVQSRAAARTKAAPMPPASAPAPAAKAAARAVGEPHHMNPPAKEAMIRPMLASSPESGAPPATASGATIAQSPTTLSAESVVAGGAAGSRAQAPAASTMSYGAQAAAPGAGGAVGGAAGLAAIAPQILVRAPDGIARWRVGVGDHIDYTPDGVNYFGANSGVAAPLLAGSAPSANVCWMVGRAGTVIRTTDGTSWTRLASPTTSDLARVAAQSADNATVFALDGRAYSTSDGGRTWSPK